MRLLELDDAHLFCVTIDAVNFVDCEEMIWFLMSEIPLRRGKRVHMHVQIARDGARMGSVVLIRLLLAFTVTSTARRTTLVGGMVATLVSTPQCSFDVGVGDGQPVMRCAPCSLSINVCQYQKRRTEPSPRTSQRWVAGNFCLRLLS